jgi:hypothetical protein
MKAARRSVRHHNGAAEAGSSASTSSGVSPGSDSDSERASSSAGLWCARRAVCIT